MTNGLHAVVKLGVLDGAENINAVGSRLLSCGRSYLDTIHVISKISSMKKQCDQCAFNQDTPACLRYLLDLALYERFKFGSSKNVYCNSFIKRPKEDKIIFSVDQII